MLLWLPFDRCKNAISLAFDSLCPSLSFFFFLLWRLMCASCVSRTINWASLIDTGIKESKRERKKVRVRVRGEGKRINFLRVPFGRSAFSASPKTSSKNGSHIFASGTKKWEESNKVIAHRWVECWKRGEGKRKRRGVTLGESFTSLSTFLLFPAPVLKSTLY